MRPGNNITGDPDSDRFTEVKTLAGLLDGLSYTTLSALQPE